MPLTGDKGRESRWAPSMGGHDDRVAPSLGGRFAAAVAMLTFVLLVSTGCGSGGQHFVVDCPAGEVAQGFTCVPENTTTATTAQGSSTSVGLALQAHNPTVSVTPATGLHDGQVVQVRLTGFGIGGKVYLSECASATAANSAGCGPQLAAQPILPTDATGSATGSFTVRAITSDKPYDESSRLPCRTGCVVVVTLGIGYGFAYAPIAFAGG